MVDGLKDFSDSELQELLSNPELRALFESDNVDYPEPSSRDSLLKFFREVLNLREEDFAKISRVGNLKDWELGRLTLTARSYLGIGLYADSEGLDSVASYLRSKGNIVFGSSLSRSAALLKLLVTQRKQSGVISPKQLVEKRGFLGSTVTESGGDD